ncbi:MAG: prepilin-type N-terminal cleavage/methylation domain-containing protein [Cyanobacteria bacterium]|nr:prepilin-type N-terminal cleavage/methylation domain-containing protein [Cyanobacteriota bacterium]
MKLFPFLNWQRLRRSAPSQHPHAGFTLIELLVAILIGSIIVTVLLQLVLELLQIERRETAIDNVQRDMRRALEYVAADVREAIYVYSTPAESQAVKALNTAGALPAPIENTVLAFWRLDPVEDTSVLNCASIGNADKKEECNVLKVRQATYTLVVYQLIANDGSDDTWTGQARIIRYELPKYTPRVENNPNLQITQGYAEPIDRSNSDLTFANWSTAGTTVGGNWAVLVDYVDAPTNPIDNAAILNCDSGMLRTPSTPATSTSFFACVQDPTADEGNLNQDVEIFVRGNFEPASGESLIRALSESSGLPTLQTGVLVRGVLDKNL